MKKTAALTPQPTNNTALHIAAKNGDVPQILTLINEGYDINTTDKFGMSALEVAISHQQTAAALLMLNQGELLNSGAKPLSLALKMKEDAVAQAIVYHPDFQPDVVAFRAFRWKQTNVLEYLVQQNVDMPVTKTLLTVKMLAHRFSLDGHVNAYPQGFEGDKPIRISLEGHYSQITARECYHSFAAYVDFLKQQPSPPEHFDAYVNTLGVLAFASQPNLNGKICMQKLYEGYLHDTPSTIFVPTGWTGHAVGVVIRGDLLFKCNRGLGSDGKNGIVAYKINNFHGFSESLFEKIIDAEGSSHFLQKEIDDLLGLTEVARFQATPQTVGNCAWVSAIESTHAILVAEMSAQIADPQQAAAVADSIYKNWQTFDLDNSILQLPNTFEKPHQKEMIDEVLAKLVASHHNSADDNDIRHSLYVLQYVDDPAQIIKNLDPEFHHALSDTIRNYVTAYEKSHWYDPLYFYLGYSEQPYDSYAKQVAFGKSLCELVSSHPDLLIPLPMEKASTALDWQEIFPDCCHNQSVQVPPTPSISESTLVLPELLDYHYNL